MKKITRRNLIKSSAALGAGTALYSPLSRGALFVPTKRSSKKAVVIGSGFGGSVASLRLAEAGIETALVERGKHWEYKGEDTFPTLGGTTLQNMKGNILWREPGLFGGSVGMLLQHVGGGIPVGVGACLV